MNDQSWSRLLGERDDAIERLRIERNNLADELARLREENAALLQKLATLEMENNTRLAQGRKP